MNNSRLTIAVAAEHIGRGVIYRPFPGAQAEDGTTIVRCSETMVFVLYRGDTTPKATRPGDLVFAS